MEFKDIETAENYCASLQEAFISIIKKCHNNLVGTFYDHKQKPDGEHKKHLSTLGYEIDMYYKKYVTYLIAYFRKNSLRNDKLLEILNYINLYRHKGSLTLVRKLHEFQDVSTSKKRVYKSKFLPKKKGGMESMKFKGPSPTDYLGNYDPATAYASGISSMYYTATKPSKKFYVKDVDGNITEGEIGPTGKPQPKKLTKEQIKKAEEVLR